MAKRAQKGARTAEKYRQIKSEFCVMPKTPGQKQYLRSIDENDVTICNGPAGSGKTLLAIGQALKLIKDNPGVYKRLILVRPYVGVEGEDMGYLPGDIDDKMAPFIAPMLDALKFFLPMSEILSYRMNGMIEIIPVSYMRGRTFNNSMIIFDEAQNSRWSHMKMFLTRIGFNSKAIVEGDMTQSDLEPRHRDENGLVVAGAKLNNVDGVGIISLDNGDVVRSPIVKKLIGYLE